MKRQVGIVLHHVMVLSIGMVLMAETLLAQDVFPVIFEAVHRAVLSAEKSGVLNKLNVDAGSHIKKGSVIAQIDTGDLGLRQKRMTQTIKYFDVQVNDLSNLSKKGLATNENLAKAVMERDLAYTDLEIIKKQIGNSVIYAPFNCVVIQRLVQPHEWVTEGKPVVEIVDPYTIRAVTNIPSHIAVKLKKDNKQTFHVPDLNISVTGILFAVSPEVDELSNTAKVMWTIEKVPAELLPGMKGEVRIELPQ